MRRVLLYTRLFIFIPVAVLGWFAVPVQAEPIQGLQAVGYNIDAIPPTKSDTVYPTCGSEIENNINRNFNGEPFQQCGDDTFMIHYTGAITIPAHNTIEFMVAADDGGTVKIGTTEFGTWDDKGCSWSLTTTDVFAVGSQSLDGWFYENGGGTCFMLAWNIDSQGWAIVPDEAFTTEVVVPTTTTSTTTTTTTTTIAPTTTTTEVPWVPTTTSTTSTTTSSTTAPTTTVPATVVESTTTTPETTTTIPETTTTTTEPEPTIAPEPTVSPVETTETTVEENIPPVEETPTTEQPAGLAQQVEELLANGEFDELINFLESDEVTEEQVLTAVESIIEKGVTEEQAFELATSEKVLESIDAEQATEIFAAIDEGSLTEEQGQEIVEALVNASEEVRESFEEEINVFGGKVDTYVPTGSTVSVATRRIIIGSTSLVLVFATPVPVARRQA